MSESHFLIVDDDPVFSRVLARSLTRKGYQTQVASDLQTAIFLAETEQFDLASVDLKLDQESGLQLIPRLRALQPHLRILMLTGYASIATAVEAIKLGADHYLPKPADTEQILQALLGQACTAEAAPPSEPMSVSRLEWEHIQKVLLEQEGNISATARALNMHRRTLQRKLAKYPVKR